MNTAHNDGRGRCRSFRFLLQPTSRQRRALEALLLIQCELYNAALQERIGAWEWERRPVSYFDQSRTLTGLRSVRPEVLDYGVVVCRGTLKRLDRAFIAFYRRCQSGDTPGFPRFKAARRWDSVQWEATQSWKLDEGTKRLNLQGIGYVKAILHRPLRGTPKAITVTRQGRRWWVNVRCVDVPPRPSPPVYSVVGLDLGVASLLSTSEGVHVDNPRHFARGREKLTREQQSLARKVKWSGRRRRQVERVAACHRHVANQRRDHAHQISRALVNEFNLICHEDLRIANMVRSASGTVENPGTNVAAKSGLNRSIHDAGWGQLIAFITYKAEEAGREVIAVNPRHTSQRCARCGHVARGNRVTQAKFRCLACGHADHADINAAVNILRAGQALRASAR